MQLRSEREGGRGGAVRRRLRAAGAGAGAGGARRGCGGGSGQLLHPAYSRGELARQRKRGTRSSRRRDETARFRGTPHLSSALHRVASCGTLVGPSQLHAALPGRLFLGLDCLAAPAAHCPGGPKAEDGLQGGPLSSRSRAASNAWSAHLFCRRTRRGPRLASPARCVCGGSAGWRGARWRSCARAAPC